MKKPNDFADNNERIIVINIYDVSGVELNLPKFVNGTESKEIPKDFFFKQTPNHFYFDEILIKI